MKKILLLLTILASVYTASAQYSMNGNDNITAKPTRAISNVASSEKFIESISVYPNPVVDVLKISFRSNLNTWATISLFNNIGKQAYIQDSEVVPGSNIVSIDVKSKGIESGIYFVQIKIGKEVSTRKLIIK